MIKLKHKPGFKALGAGLLLAMASLSGLAQEGHPLNGSWSGERSVDGEDSRVLLVLDLQRDQSFSGYLIERGARIPLKSATLDPEDWSVNLVLEGEDRSGKEVSYEVDGKIENLGSFNSREIVGTWTDGSERGDFHVTLN